MSFIAFLLSLMCFLLDAFKVAPGGFSMLTAGLFFMALGFVLGCWPPTWWKS